MDTLKPPSKKPIQPVSITCNSNIDIESDSSSDDSDSDEEINVELKDKIIIIDDSPNVWLNSTDLKIKFLVPNEFRGNKEDMGLQNIISSNL